MCTECGSRDPGRRFAQDGTARLLCARCVADSMRIAAAHETIRRIHRAAHGYDDPCPVCAADPWLEAQRQAEEVEQELERSRVQAEFTADLRIPRPPRIRRVA